ncbi:alpha-glucosidase [Algicella marina]|uniref:Alpha-glucosidase n=1 Tax=Algicella marina TaxID=2683284 RepID=A0A6P1T3I4_9RHOB|nr:alpha-glucosidase [Algicella marina]QHQ36577.1 alpha-glucosidase [Algicella marina]
MNFALPVGQQSAVTKDPDWWRGAVIYQIYPRSYQDSNGDGVGDLSGIIHRLPYVASLGVDAIWISPFFTSPMLDFGYDVSNYRDVDPMFGSLGDFDALIERAHELGLRVMIDLVLSHTSSEHAWFKESRSSRDNPRADWYVWADARPDGTPPNNWLSIFGGSAWHWDAERLQYYLHNFLVSQPDLNFHNPDVQNSLLDVARFWLDRGVDGFRLDTINFYFHDKELTGNPALEPGERNASIAPAVNPYNFQNHLHDKNQPENLEFLERFRSLMDEYEDIAAVGEVGDAQYGLEIMGQYTEGEKRMHMCYSFDFLSPEHIDGRRVSEVLKQFADKAPDSWSCWAFSNHDVMRHASRWNLGEPAVRCHLALLMTLRGSACIYQGEELGLTEAYVSYEELQDPYGKEFWPKFKGRDGCRTPMPWSPEGPNGGFTDTKPWLPMAMEHLPKSVQSQEGDPNSTLNFYRNLIAFRRMRKVLAKGTITVLDASREVLTFTRDMEGEASIFCAFNLSGAAQVAHLPPGPWAEVEGTGFTSMRQEGQITLPPFQAFFAEG